MIITQGTPYPLGTTVYRDGIHFAYVSRETDCGVVFFDGKTLQETVRVAFPEEFVNGDIHCMYVTGISTADTVYCFYEKEALVTDIRAKVFLDEKPYNGDRESCVRLAAFAAEDYNWEGDSLPKIPYEKSIGYCVHVRGFSVHTSSKVKARGTYGGIVEKIPYLKELGVTTLELQPAYEFEEREGEKINYWGYKKGYYYVPKESYAIKNPVTEFKDMVKELHKNNLEVVMQFYFTEETSKREISDILAYWSAEYHVDGFHLKGANIDAGMLAQEPALSKVKLWYYGFPAGLPVQNKRLASYTEYYRYDIRRFLKGDEGMISTVMYHLRHNPSECGQINYLTNYDGFTLADMVSYNQKHNEANGEDNRDGTDYNASWNCGQEGNSRKKTVQALRKRQIKNAMLLLFLSQATPLIFMGDEFGNSQQGNNNPYCQDNEVTWLDWKEKDKAVGKAIYEFTKKVISLRKNHPVFCRKEELRLADYAALGCPDISYHGQEAWKPDTSVESRQLGILYCGEYARKDNVPDDYFYVAYNMHWETKRLALPKLPKGLYWTMELTSDEGAESEKMSVTLPGRCICVYRSVGERKQDLHESRTAF